jgi:pimeloyl-ACP methyl ester carboxylesterase
MKRIVLFLPALCFFGGAAFAQQSTEASFARPDLVKKFEIHVSQQRLDSVMDKVKNATLPRRMPPMNQGEPDWQTGMDVNWLKELQQYWSTTFDWRKQEKLLNSYPQYIADVDGYKIQFYYIKGEGKNPLPMVMTHGWPGSTFEFFNVIDPLTHPSKHGGKTEDAFTLIIPALPGFGFSSMPSQPINAFTTARLWNKLVTEVIGHESYVAQGGDWGAGLTVHLAYLFPKNVKAIDVNFFPGVIVPDSIRTDSEKVYYASIAKWQAQGFDYWRIQADKPLMTAVALKDSPLGTAGWIAEKFWAWADYDGQLESVISKERLLTDIMLYIINDDGIDGSFWYYRGALVELKGISTPGYISVPTAISKFPKDMPVSRPPLATAKRMYNVYSFTDLPKGGHFAAMEQPEIFVDEIRKVFHSFH